MPHMKKPYGDFSEIVIRLILLTLFIAGSIAVSLSLYPRMGRGRWGEVSVLMVDAEAPLREVVTRLQTAGITGVVSSLTQQMEFTRFDGTESVTVHDLPGRLDRLDPRLDPYMQSLGEYFYCSWQGGDFHLLYLPVAGRVISLHLRLRRIFRGSDIRWILPESHRSPRWTAFVLFLGFVVYLCFRIRSIWGWAVAVPWILGFRQGDYGFLFAAFVGFWAWSRIIVEIPVVYTYYLNYGTPKVDKERIMRYLYLLAISIGVALLALPLGWYSAGGAGFVFTAHGLSLMLACFQGVVCLWKHRTQTHRLFFSVSILDGKRAETTAGLNRSIDRLTPFAAILILPLLLMLSVKEIPRIPLPISLPEVEDQSWESLSRLRLLGIEDHLPDVSDYLSHMAYQDTIAFGGEYRFPNRGDTHTLPSYAWEDGRVVVRKRVMLEFTEAWYQDILRAVPENGILAMLSTEGRFLGATVTSPTFLPDIPLFFMSHIACCFLILFSLFVQVRLHAYIVYGVRTIIVRRKRQAA